MKTLKTWLITTALVLTSNIATADNMYSPAELIEQMKQGGLVIYIRHARTEIDYADQVTADPNNCSTQRTLSEAGWQDAVTIGNAFSFYGIPANKILSSQYCRAWQTAYLAFERYKKREKLNFLPFEDYTPEQILLMQQRVMPFLTRPVANGKNRVIVAHDDPFEAATGIYPEPMGSAYLVKPDNAGGFEVLGCIAPDGWSTLDGQTNECNMTPTSY